jgi:iron complex outermembrane receptor protein
LSALSQHTTPRFPALPYLPVRLLAVGFAWTLCAPATVTRAETEATPSETEATLSETEVGADESSGTPDPIEAEPGEFDPGVEEGVRRTGEALDDDTEEIIIFGEKSEGTILDTPVSVVEFDSSELQREQIVDIADLANYTPNLEIKTAFAASNPTIFIRGVGLDDFNANAVSAVAVYQDGVYMNSPAGQLFQFFDTAGVEVLRGPQAGRYRNASAGAILVRSEMPTDDFNGYARFSYGNYDLIDIEGAASGAIPGTEDSLSGRVAFRFQQRDGVTENRCAGRGLEGRTSRPPACLKIQFPEFNLGTSEQNPLEQDVNDIDHWATRGLLRLVAPIGDVDTEWLLNVHAGENNSLSTQYQNRGFRPAFIIDPETGERTEIRVPGKDRTNYEDVDGDPYAGDYNITGPEDLDLWGTSLRGVWNPGGDYEVSSISGFEWHDRHVLDHTDGNPRQLLTIEYNDEAWQFSQELQFSKTWFDRVDSDLGAYFIMEDLDAYNYFDTPTFAANTDQTYTQKTRGWALFGTGTWDFLESFTLDAAFRYAWEYKELDIRSRLFGRQGEDFLEPVAGKEDDLFSGPAGSISLTYHWTDDKDFYLKYTRGWKPGHFNGGAVLSGTIIEPVEPEKVDSIEGGFQTSWFDGLLDLSGAAFFYSFENMQIFQLQQEGGSLPIFQLINAQKAEILGVEFGLRAIPIEGLDIRYDVSWLDSEYPEFTSTIPRVIRAPGAPPVITMIPVDYTGNRLLGSPEWSMSGAIEYEASLPRELGFLIPRFSFSYKDKMFFDPAEGKGALQTLPDDTIAQKAHWLFNASLLWRNAGEWLEISGWVRNITDEAVRLQSSDITDGFNFVQDVYGDPRTYGFTVSAYF